MGRTTVKPQYYGKRKSSAFLSDSETENENSEDDLDYVPVENEISEDDLEYTNIYDPACTSQKAKKKKTSHHDETQEIRANDDLNGFTLNEEFNVIAAISDQQIDKNQSKTLDAGETSARSVENINKTQSKTVENEIMHSGETKFDMKIFHLTQKLYENSVETLARISILEEAVLNNQVSKMKNHETEQSKTRLEQFHLFIKSMDLPMTSIDQVKRLEVKLADDDFREATVSTLSQGYAFIILMIFM